MTHQMPAKLCEAAAEDEDRQEQLAGLEELSLGGEQCHGDDAGGLAGWEEEGAAAAASRVEAEQRASEEAARVEAARSDRARKLWRAAALAEGQKLRVEALRERQARDVVAADRKRDISAQVEREISELLAGKSFDAVLSHFGAASYKKLLVEYHPDRAPAGASFEEATRREVIFKYVQQRRDQIGSDDDPDQPARAQEPKASEDPAARRRRRRSDEDQAAKRRSREYAEAEAWRTRQAAAAGERARQQKRDAAEEAERQRNALPETAVLRCENAITGWGGVGHATALGPFGYYEVDSRGDINGKPAYRKIPWPPRADWAPWAAKAAQDAAEAADQIWWSGICWQLGHRAEQRLTYMAATTDERPPGSEWDVVDSRAAQPKMMWL